MSKTLPNHTVALAVRCTLALSGALTFALVLSHALLVVSVPIMGAAGDRDDHLLGSGLTIVTGILLAAAGLAARLYGGAARTWWGYGSTAGLLLLLGVLWAISARDLEGQAPPLATWLDGVTLAFRLPFTGLFAAAVAVALAVRMSVRVLDSGARGDR